MQRNNFARCLTKKRNKKEIIKVLNFLLTYSEIYISIRTEVFMKEVKFVRLSDIYLIRDRENVFHLCINSGGKYIARFNEFEISESNDKSSRIDLYSNNIDMTRKIDLVDFLFGIPDSYSDASLSDSKIEGNVLYMWQIMINDENVQKALNDIYSSVIIEGQKSRLQGQLRKEFLKNLLRGYSSFTEETFEDSKSSDIYHYFDKEMKVRS